MAAVKAALAEGVDELDPRGGADASVSAGEDLLIHALEQPFRILLTNSGLNAGECLPQVRAA